MKFELNYSNYKYLPNLLNFLKEEKTERLEIIFPSTTEKIFSFSETLPFIYQVLDYELFLGVWLVNFPPCVINDNSRDHVLFRKRIQGEKLKKCERCKYFKSCSGFPSGYFKKYSAEEVLPIADIPLEIMIEVEPKCNFNCSFCYNKVSFAKKDRDGIKKLSGSYIKKIIDEVAKIGIKNLRFTGGEPLLRPDIFQLMNYAKKKNLYVILNTNGSLIDSNVAKKIKKTVDNVLIPIESWQHSKEAEITGYRDSLKNKIRAVELLKKEGVSTIRIGTVATLDNILNFDKIANLISTLPADEWEFYRPIPLEKESIDLNYASIKVLVNKIITLRSRSKKNIYIANSIPFCALKDFNKINHISKGALFEGGHSRMVVDSRGFLKPHYFMNQNLGSPLDIMSAWNSNFMKKMRNLKFLPMACKKCVFSSKCRGGSRYIAKLINNSYYAIDPLARFYKKIN